MSDTLFGGWLQESDSRQSRRIDELGDSLEYVRASMGQHYRTASALRSDLASLRGSMEARLARLTVAFDAFVELSSLRDQLSLVAGPALVRQATRARLVALGTPGSGPVLDVTQAPPAPGYWLADALEALDPGHDDAAERAAAVDLRRTATFLTVAGAACGRADLVARWLTDALGTFDGGPVTRAQRALWVAAAEGRLGPAARAVLLARLRAAVASVPAATADAAVTAWTEQVRHTAGTGRPVSRTADNAVPELQSVRRTVRVLATLRALADADLAAAGDESPTDRAGAATGDRAPAGGVTDPPSDATLDELVAVLRALVDEGAEEERTLMARVTELEGIVSGGAPHPAWDAPGEDLLTLLREDALTRHDALGEVAREATRTWLLDIADAQLRHVEAPLPDHVTGKVLGVTVRAYASGAVEGQDAALAQANPPLVHAHRATWAALALAATAVAGWVAALVSTPEQRWTYALLAAVPTAGALALLARRLRHAHDHAQHVRGSVAFVEREVGRLQEQARQAARSATAYRQDAREHHARVTTAWAAAAADAALYGTPPDVGAAPAAGPSDALYDA